MASHYMPGSNPAKEYTRDKYNDHQWHIWTAVAQVTYAHTHGRLDTLRPMPGSKIDMVSFRAWQLRALAGWQQETRSRGRGRGNPTTAPYLSRAIVEEDLPMNAWLWLYQRIKSAPPKPVAVTSTGSYG